MEPSRFYNKKNTLENKKIREGAGDKEKKVLQLLSQHQLNRFLDIGCGSIFLSKEILENYSKKIEEYHGIDISDAGVIEAKKLGIKAVKINIDSEALPYKDNYFDFILAGDLIEHLFDPDHLILEAYRVLKKGGYFLLTTPNLAAWHNRIVLLLGYQPHFSEVSTKYNVGKLFNLYENEIGGHLRLFTLRALREFLTKYNFRIVKVLGQGANIFIDKLISYFPCFSSVLIVLCQKTENSTKQQTVDSSS